jgi:predicted CopG family antitoxin
MITISITPDAYEAIKATLPKGAKPYATQREANGDYRIAIDRKTADRLARMRQRGESYSDVILRLARA